MPDFYLGIESTAHTFGVGIVDSKGKCLANERVTYVPKKGEGFVPSDLGEHHSGVAAGVLRSAVGKAGIRFADVKAFAFSQGPGIPNALRTGAAMARYLSLKHGKPLVGVNHCIAHIEIGRLATACNDPVVLYLSGGNTQVIAFAEGRYMVFGETQDIPIGNAIDSLARGLGIKFPYGRNFDTIAAFGKSYIEFPYVVKGMDLSFSGMLTAALKERRKGAGVNDICRSFQETSYAMLTEVAERALAHTGKKEVLLVGGVAASRRMQDMIAVMCRERGAKPYVVPVEFSSDNGAMIAWTGQLALRNGKPTKIDASGLVKKWRTDEVEVTWR
jgi:N6-L-threonylcarbamoyladenine synthase